MTHSYIATTLFAPEQETKLLLSPLICGQGGFIRMKERSLRFRISRKNTEIALSSHTEWQMELQWLGAKTNPEDAVVNEIPKTN